VYITSASSGKDYLYQLVSGLTVGAYYTFSCYVQLETASPDPFRVWFEDTGGVVLAQSAGITAPVDLAASAWPGSWTRLEVTFAATATSMRCAFGRLSADATKVNTWDISAAQMEETPAERLNYSRRSSSYVDGDQGRGWWTGAPHASTSKRDGTRQVFVTNISEQEIQRPGVGDLLRGRGPESRVTLTVVEV
jgi:hypothetical protein